MRGVARLVFLLVVSVSVCGAISSDNAFARGGGGGGGGFAGRGGGFSGSGSGFAGRGGGGAHFAFRSATAGVHGGGHANRHANVHVVNKHAHTAGFARARAFANRRGHGRAELPLWTWGWAGADTYPEMTIAIPAAPATEASAAPPIPEALPPCREAQFGVTIIRGKSCRT
jgi:hypothetical protein